MWLKREDLAHTGAHKINNSIGQVLLAKKLGAKRVIAETGAGQHGVASAAACARLGMPCTVYMGSVDMERQAPNVGRMKLLGATVVPVTSGDQTLRAAVDEALRDWVSDPNGTYYCLGSAIGPHPYPYLVRELQSVIGREAREQMLEQHRQAAGHRRSPASAAARMRSACSIRSSRIATCRCSASKPAASAPGSGENAASLAYGTPGVLQGSYSLLLQDENGQIQETHSVSAGLDYPGVGPEHALLMSVGRVKYEAVDDDDALAALAECCAAEGILPAIESAHALAGAKRYAQANPGSEDSHRPVRPRRQGHADAAADAAEGCAVMAAGERDQRSDPQREGERAARRSSPTSPQDFPTRETFVAAADCGRGGGGRRRDRRAVHRSDGGRHDDSALEPRRARAGRVAALDSRRALRLDVRSRARHCC